MEKEVPEDDVSNEEEMMDQYMDRTGQQPTSSLTFLELRKLRNREFIDSVKAYLGEPNNKQLEVYVANFKKNMVLGFIKKTEKDLSEGLSTRTKGGHFMHLCKEFAFKTHKDDDVSAKVRDILKRINKGRNAAKSKRRKQRKRDMQTHMVVEGLRNLRVDATS